MPELNTWIAPDAPIRLVASRPLFRTDAIRNIGCPSLIRLGSGRVLLVYRTAAVGPSMRGDGVLMLSHSDDGGRTWEEPLSTYAVPGWDCLPMGGLVHFSDDLIRHYLGRVKVDLDLGGPEPFSAWYSGISDSRDGGQSWSEPGAELKIWPHWTEMYGASNPHKLSDGRNMLVTIGTQGRDEGWRAGATFTDAAGREHSPPTIIAAQQGLEFADTDAVRLGDGRFLAVIREMTERVSYQSHSSDEGKTWTPIRRTPFRASNTKLHRLRSGAILCAYRDEDPERRGVGCSVTTDGGETWRHVARLYAAPASTAHRPGFLCGYPDMVHTSERSILAMLHTYPDAEGRVDMHQIDLEDLT